MNSVTLAERVGLVSVSAMCGACASLATVTMLGGVYGIGDVALCAALGLPGAVAGTFAGRVARALAAGRSGPTFVLVFLTAVVVGGGAGAASPFVVLVILGGGGGPCWIAVLLLVACGVFAGNQVIRAARGHRGELRPGPAGDDTGRSPVHAGTASDRGHVV